MEVARANGRGVLMSITAGQGGSEGWSLRTILEWFTFGAIWSVILWGFLDRAIRRHERRS